MLPGCEEHWLAAARPRMQALLEAQLGAEAPDVRARGLAFDAILSLPAHSLVRVRGESVGCRAPFFKNYNFGMLHILDRNVHVTLT